MVNLDARNPQDPPTPRRLSNDRLAESAAAFRFDAATRVPFWCECRDPACEVSVPMTLSDYRLIGATGDPLLAPSHLLLRADDA